MAVPATFRYRHRLSSRPLEERTPARRPPSPRAGVQFSRSALFRVPSRDSRTPESAFGPSRRSVRRPPASSRAQVGRSRSDSQRPIARDSPGSGGSPQVLVFRVSFALISSASPEWSFRVHEVLKSKARSWGGAGERGNAGQEREREVGLDVVGNAISFEPALRKSHVLDKARSRPNYKLLKIIILVRLVVFQIRR